jgi:hypothetical protein
MEKWDKWLETNKERLRAMFFAGEWQTFEELFLIYLKEI